jgi:hypothetical protein
VTTKASTAAMTGKKSNKVARRAKGKARFRREINTPTAPTGLNIG